MTTVNLFRSLNAISAPDVGKSAASKPEALLSNVQPIGSRQSQAAKWALFQSMHATAWEPSPALSAQEKQRRRPQEPLAQADLPLSNVKISISGMAMTIADGLKVMGRLPRDVLPEISPVSPPASSLEIPIEAPPKAPVALFRSRSSSLFGASSSPHLDAIAAVPSKLPIRQVANDSLLGLFDRLQSNGKQATGGVESLASGLRRLSQSQGAKR